MHARTHMVYQEFTKNYSNLKLKFLRTVRVVHLADIKFGGLGRKNRLADI